MRPLIGLTPNRDRLENNEVLRINRDYMDSVLRSGGIPVLLPLTDDRELLRDLADELDGLIVTGGADIDPYVYGEENLYSEEIDPVRDRMELVLVRLFSENRKPLLGICRGEQIMNCALGGTMVQDIERQKPGSLRHPRSDRPAEAVHTVKIREGSLLYRIIGKSELGVNSRHHQAADRIGQGLTVSARAEDGVTEAIEMAEHPFALGVQWHPESMSAKVNDMKRIFDALVSACRGE